MRSRILLLYVLASLLGTPVLLHRSERVSACANLDPATCGATFPDPWWMVPLGLLSLGALGYATYLLAVALAARRREKEMLEAVGVQVREQDLPLDE